MAEAGRPVGWPRSWLNVKAREGDYRTEKLVAALVFIVNVASFRPGPMSSAGGVETWLNLTNQMFYGSQDFLFSYGPMYWIVGGVSEHYSAWSYWLTVVTVSALSTLFWTPVVTLVFRSRALTYFGLAFLLFYGTLIFTPLLFLWPFAIVCFLEFADDKPLALGPALTVALGLLLGASFCVRYFYGLIGLATFGAYFFSRLPVTRRPWELLLLVGSTVLGYVSVGLVIFRSPGSLRQYLEINTQLSFGNSVDMTLAVTTGPATAVAAGLVVAILLIYCLLSRRVLFLALAAILAVLVKLGFSRTDHHIAYFVLPAAALSLLLLFGKVRSSRPAFLVVIGLLSYLSFNEIFPGSPTHNPLIAPVNTAASYAERMAARYGAFKLPDAMIEQIGDGTIDVYPFQNEYAFGNDLNYVHRPLFQNYMTLTPALDALNRGFFESPDRPKFVLWVGAQQCSEECNAFVDVDGKLALNEDPLTTSAILLNYHFVTRSTALNGAELLLLESNETVTPYTEAQIAKAHMEFGQWYTIPAGPAGVTKLVPEFQFTWLGRATNLLFRGAVMSVSYRLQSGAVKQFRLNILNSQSGIWASPLPSDLSFAGDEVDAIMITIDTGNYIEPNFPARWVSVPIRPLTIIAQ